MKKKIMGVILAATLIVSQAVTAFAGSKTSEVVLPNDFAAYYTVTEGTRGICRGRGSFPTDS